MVTKVGVVKGMVISDLNLFLKFLSESITDKEKVPKVVNKIKELYELSPKVEIDIDNPSEQQLEKLYNTMLEVGGFDDELIQINGFVDGVKH